MIHSDALIIPMEIFPQSAHNYTYEVTYDGAVRTTTYARLFTAHTNMQQGSTTKALRFSNMSVPKTMFYCLTQGTYVKNCLKGDSLKKKSRFQKSDNYTLVNLSLYCTRQDKS